MMLDMPGVMTVRAFTQVDGGGWSLTEWVLHDPLQYRRLVRTQMRERRALTDTTATRV